MKVYDSYDELILYRTYPNLHPNAFTYSYPGPVIYVNSFEKVYVERGTVSDYIPITLDYPCSLNLTLVPYLTGITFLPTRISLNTGDIQT